MGQIPHFEHDFEQHVGDPGVVWSWHRGRRVAQACGVVASVACYPVQEQVELLAIAIGGLELVCFAATMQFEHGTSVLQPLSLAQRRYFSHRRQFALASDARVVECFPSEPPIVFICM